MRFDCSVADDFGRGLAVLALDLQAAHPFRCVSDRVAVVPALLNHSTTDWKNKRGKNLNGWFWLQFLKCKLKVLCFISLGLDSHIYNFVKLSFHLQLPLFLYCCPGKSVIWFFGFGSIFWIHVIYELINRFIFLLETSWENIVLPLAIVNKIGVSKWMIFKYAVLQLMIRIGRIINKINNTKRNRYAERTCNSENRIQHR